MITTLNSKIKKWLEKIISFLFGEDEMISQLYSLTPEELLSIAGVRRNIKSDRYFYSLSYSHSLIQKGIKLLKYHGNQKMARLFGEILAEEINAFLAENGQMSDFNKPILAPIPISKQRRKERGFNQVELICQEILNSGLQDMLEYQKDLLIKVKDTPSQVKLESKKDRVTNLKDCFIANPKIAKKRNVILIDDVLTTGTTAKEAIKALHRAGAKKIVFFAVAH
jgi:competence protein ComFC